jgi:hypothetical protein
VDTRRSYGPARSSAGSRSTDTEVSMMASIDPQPANDII